MTSPILQYKQDLSSGKLLPDDAQANAIEHLDTLHHQLVEYLASNPSWRTSLKYLFKKPKIQAPKGLYFWGGVGRGKTYMMDLFYHSLPTEQKMRVHFHRFMHRVHNELKLLGGQSDPLITLADKLAKEAKVICFDEFFVSDITDAMILAGLIQALFEHGVVLVATSNIEPQGLYRNGLQRQRFLPAIDLIEKNCLVLNVDSGVDYRLRTLTQAEIYHSPCDKNALANLDSYFSKMAIGDISTDDFIQIENRKIAVHKLAQDLVWFDFRAICDGPRSQNDYIELSQCFHTVLLSNVEQMGHGTDDIARRFIALVDEFYERNVKLIIAAQVPMEQLYTQGLLSFEFKRCLSRLQEMQSTEFLAKPHLA
ncbi:AFG1-like ATPase [Catenovulum agarivorans DS-2]|uniref:Cell division protein ZapE n=1 Tax=Catenovulum agarivorans DS-2 TaxID=1328313 RepID=W7QQX2_9ALTE|nr:cell division protein ZapE [Catenovulum agarivorans]EWH10268.1 AFG1-like ATPase [Catenovulum agarivorans DS-2]